MFSKQVIDDFSAVAAQAALPDAGQWHADEWSFATILRGQPTRYLFNCFPQPEDDVLRGREPIVIDGDEGANPTTVVIGEGNNTRVVGVAG